ncbi:MAG: hypothetical protein J0L73_28290 [Verrucomicrobia bacterium]|nr:hypothetical protein [Verrucomicrobiota bacterium]
MKQFYLALVPLAVIHSLISFGALGLFTTRVEMQPSQLEKRTNFPQMQYPIVFVSRPAVIVWHMGSGCIGLAAVLLCAIYHALRTGHY